MILGARRRPRSTRRVDGVDATATGMILGTGTQFCHTLDSLAILAAHAGLHPPSSRRKVGLKLWRRRCPLLEPFWIGV